MSSHNSVICCVCDWNGSPATFDMNSQQIESNGKGLSILYEALKDVYPNLPQPFIAGRATYSLTYRDDDGDLIELESSDDLLAAMSVALARQPSVLELFVSQPPTSQLASSSLFGEGAWESVKSHDEQQIKNPPVQIEEVIGSSSEPTPPTESSSVSSSSSQQQQTPFDEPEVSEVAVSSTPLKIIKAEEVPASSPPVAASPSSGWSLFNIFGSRTQATPVTVPVVTAEPLPVASAAPVVTEAKPIELIPSSAPQQEFSPNLLKSRSDSLASSLSSSSSQSIAKQAEREFWELDSQQASIDVSGSGVNSFVQMDLANAQNALSDSTELTSNVLARIFNSMISRTEERLGLDSSMASMSSGFVNAPQQALLVALSGLDEKDFDSLINQFANLCANHVENREHEKERLETEKIEAIRLELEREALEAELDARLAAEAAEASRRQDEERYATALREEEEENRRREEERVAEAERLAEEENARLEEQERLETEEHARREEQENLERAQREQRELREQQEIMAVRSLEQSPVIVPAVPVPVAQPIMAEAASVASRFNSCLAELRAMGFTDDALNTYMLQKTNLDMAATIDWLMTDSLLGGELKNEIQLHRV